MHYVVGDIHNEREKLRDVLQQIQLESGDELILLGDVFDRGTDDRADPVGVYFELCKIQGKCTWVCGNHDRWLSEYIKDYYGQSERKQKKIPPYRYNSFGLMKARLTPVDMLDIAEIVSKLPLQIEREIGGKKYLFSHAMAFSPDAPAEEMDYLTGNENFEDFLLNGVHGFISICGHTPTGNIQLTKGQYMDANRNSIWRNEKKNVYMLDCGCGFGSGKLACICLETGKRFYA